MAIAIYQRGASLHATWHDRRPHIPLLKQTLLGAKLSDEITQDSRGHPRLFTYSGYRKIRNAHYEDKDNDMPSCGVVSVGKVPTLVWNLSLFGFQLSRKCRGLRRRFWSLQTGIERPTSSDGSASSRCKLTGEVVQCQ